MKVNESDTRLKLIDPKLKQAGWDVIQDSMIKTEYPISAGRIQKGRRGKALKADYVLIYKGIKLAIVEAKKSSLSVSEGVAQAKLYAGKLNINITYATNGKEIYRINMETGEEKLVEDYDTPDELWHNKFSDENEWVLKFAQEPFKRSSEGWLPRYYQENAITSALEKIAQDKKRILLTLATGAGKTAISFQIAWKLFQTRWNLRKDGKRQPRVLFLADRNTLANQAFNSFGAFPDDALVRISPKEISKKGSVPKNGSVFFTIFQTFMTEVKGQEDPVPNFGQYPSDYFDLVIVDECHRGGAKDESNWRGILDYFSPAVQIGLTATPKRKDNVDTYDYFGKPVYTYSLKEGIEDGFLTPFRVKRIQTTLDTYVYTSDDRIIEGEESLEAGKRYEEKDFNRIIEIDEREKERVRLFLDDCNQNEKSIVFCKSQPHAGLVRDLINQISKSNNPNYCARVVADDGAIGDKYLEDFQDNEKYIPTILTTSQKLSTGVDARNVRNIVLMREVNSMIEFKQIVGRGTRVFEGKEFFTIYDYVDAQKHFADPEWDGEPLDPIHSPDVPPLDPEEPDDDVIDGDGDDDEGDGKKKFTKIKIKLREGKELEIEHMISTSFWGASGKPISAEEFINDFYGKLPQFFKSEKELREIWSKPDTRARLLKSFAEAGYGVEQLKELQKICNAEKSDLFDVLEYLAYQVKPITRKERAEVSRNKIFNGLDDEQKSFLEFVLMQYINLGVQELDKEKLPELIKLKYKALGDAKQKLGDVSFINKIFVDMQRDLYS